jgi:heme exporter protein C
LQAAKAVAVLTLAGFINIPIVKFSVDWWSTLHQPASVFRLGGPTMHASYLNPLLFCALGFSFLFAAMLTAAMRNEILRRRVRTLTIFAASEVR